MAWCNSSVHALTCPLRTAPFDARARRIKACGAGTASNTVGATSSATCIGTLRPTSVYDSLDATHAHLVLCGNGASSVQLARRGLLARQLDRLLALVRHLLLHPALRVGQPYPGLGAPFDLARFYSMRNKHLPGLVWADLLHPMSRRQVDERRHRRQLARGLCWSVCTRFIRSNTVDRARHLGFTQAPCICSPCVCT